MSGWTRLCAVDEAPAPGEVREIEAGDMTLCVANVDGELHALENWCPHRQGPLGQGWIEGRAVVCPWHAWSFNCGTGVAEPPEKARVRVFPVSSEGGTVLVNLT